MQQKHLNFRISNELKDAFDRFADENFAGSVSDAGRFIMVQFFHPKTPPLYRAVLAAYHNVLPQLHQAAAGIGAKAEKEFSKQVQKALSRLTIT